MVKIFLSFLFLFSLSFAEDNVTREEDFLSLKIENLLGSSMYEKDKSLLNVLFDPKSSFYKNDRVEVIKVVKTLEENGLLNLFFSRPQEIKLHFLTSGSPLFFVKLMDESLRNIGYYRYVTTAALLNRVEFKWSITLTSEYATNPLVLEKELNKRGCYITDVKRHSANEWTYTVDMRSGFLNLVELQSGQEVKLKHSLYAHWLNCSKIEKLRVKSTRRNNWYPDIAYYDSSLHLIKVLKRDKKSRNVIFRIPIRAKYMKISDMYTLKNVKDELVLTPLGKR